MPENNDPARLAAVEWCGNVGITSGALAEIIRKHYAEQTAELERLREYKADIQNAVKGAMDERCVTEKHCTCVPLLRVELKRLRAVVAAAEELFHKVRTYPTCALEVANYSAARKAVDA